jgi:PAS domain S-box-containing protein
MNDLTEEFDLEQRAALFQAQTRLLKLSARGVDLEEVLGALCREIESLFDRSARCSVVLVDNGRLQHVASPSMADAFVEAIDGLEIGPNVGSCGTAAFTGETVVVEDVSTHPLWEDYQDLVRLHDLVACWSTPVFNADGEVVATFAVYPYTKTAPSEHERRLIDAFCDLAEILIERALATRELTSEKRRLAAVVEGTAAGAWEWNPQDDAATVTDDWAGILGYTVAELEPISFEQLASLAHPDDVEQVQRAIEEHFRGESDFIETEFRMRHKNGHWVWLLDRGRVFERDEDGNPTLVAGMHLDITERKERERQLQRMQRLESLGRLAGGIAHDFNNILMGFFASVSFARESLEADHPAHTELSEAEAALDRAKRLTGQLLTFAKGGAPVKDDVGLQTLVERVVRFDLSGSQTKPVFDIDDDLWMAHADQGQLQQVVSNLTVNAREAMEEAGHLYVSLENTVIDANSDLPLAPGRYVHARFRDDGPGIDPENIDRIFDPYFSRKESGQGLGLATVFSIVEQHGGHVSVESGDGGGATFDLYFPASADGTRADTSASQEDAESPSETDDAPLRILVVDDDDAVRRVCRKMLETLGHEVRCTSDGLEALGLYERCRDNGESFDLVVLDMTIPGGLGGTEAVKALLDVDPTARVVASTGYAEDPVLANYADYGFVGIIPKPYTLDQLSDTIADAL